MTHEIERKFFTTISCEAIRAKYPEEFKGFSEIEQRYLGDTGEWAIRLRQDHFRKVMVGGNVPFIDTTSHILTMKRKVTDVTCIELETRISIPHYREWITHCPPVPLRKRRSVFLHGGHTWYLDEFLNSELAGIAYAEIELKSEDEIFARPPWLGEEITSDPQYRNFAMMRRIKQV